MLENDNLNAIGQELDYLVFVQGVNVTEHVQSLDKSFGIENSIEIAFKNHNDALTLTPDNLRGEWRIFGSSKASTETSKDASLSNAPLLAFSEAAKKAIYDYKVEHNTEGPDGRLSTSNLKRWTLLQSEPIIHRMDTVRVFIKNPNTDADEWFSHFNGYVASVNDNKNLINGQGSLNISCRDAKMVLAKCRLAQNPLIQGFGAMADRVIDDSVTPMVGLFRDVVLPRNQFTNVLYNRQPQEMVSFMIFGTYYADQNTSDANLIHGFGNFRHTPSHPRFHLEGKNGNPNLERWHDACLHGSRSNGQTRTSPLTRDECIKLGFNSQFSGSRSSESPHGSNRSVRFLYPTSGFGFSTLKSPTLNNMDSYEADWVSRLDLIESILQPLNYKFWISGNGDMIFEYPLEDFEPAMFGKYQPHLTLKDIQSTSHSENDVDLPTLLTINGGDSRTGVDLGEEAQKFYRIDLVFPSLASRLGINHETVSFPYTYAPDQLAFYGLTLMQQKMATLESYGVSDLPVNPYLLPNRPIYLPDIDLIATVDSGSHSLSNDPSASTSVSLNHPRRRGNDGRFLTIFGSVNTPISYNFLYKPSNSFLGALDRFQIDNPDIMTIISASGQEFRTNAKVNTNDDKINAPNSQQEANKNSAGRDTASNSNLNSLNV